LIGWMSNWMYANVVPTQSWRSAMTIPRELKLIKLGKEWRLASQPISSLGTSFKNKYQKGQINVIEKVKLSAPAVVSFEADAAKDFSVTYMNDQQEKIEIRYDAIKQNFFIDRRASGQTTFHPEFATIHTAPRLSKDPLIKIQMVFDKTSIELFADNGLTVMTSIFFPKKPYQECWVDPKKGLIKNLIIQ